MSETFFIGDTHFGHKNIIRFEPELRPFTTIEEHNAELVRRWNSVVGVKDTVYHLGDFCFGKANLAIGHQLNGDKRLIMGNHDHYPSADYLTIFTKILGAMEYDRMICTHLPIHPSAFPRYTMNIHGHTHGKQVMRFVDDCRVEPDMRYFNVSCEQIDCTPIPFSVIKKAYWDNQFVMGEGSV